MLLPHHGHNTSIPTCAVDGAGSVQSGFPPRIRLSHNGKWYYCYCLSTQLIWATTWQNQQSECVPSEDSDQPGHPPSLIRVFAVRWMGSQGPKLSSCGQRRLWSDWADAQADLSLRWAYSHFVGFVMSRLIWLSVNSWFCMYALIGWVHFSLRDVCCTFSLQFYFE